MKSLKSVIILAFVVIASFSAFSQKLTADAVLGKAAAAARGAKGIAGTFSIAMGRGSVNGTIKASGTRFAIETPASSSWYNGKELYTYNPRSKETTVVIPTAGEISEVNPLSYLNSYATAYKGTFAPKQTSGAYTVVLTPKNKYNAVKRVEVVINKTTWKPQRFVIEASSGEKSTLAIKQLNYNASVSSSTFAYPKGRFPGVEIVDLR